MSTSGTARNTGQQVVHYLGRDITFGTVGIGTADTVKVGRVPAGSFLMPAMVRITTAFNAVTTNVLTVGQNTGSDNDIVAAGELNEAATGVTIVATGCALTFANDTDIYVRYTQTGTAATAGAASIVIPYLPPNW